MGFWTAQPPANIVQIHSNGFTSADYRLENLKGNLMRLAC